MHARVFYDLFFPARKMLQPELMRDFKRNRLNHKQPQPLSELTLQEKLRRFWVATGRGGTQQLVHYARQHGERVSLEEAGDFIKAQAASQVFRPPPRSDGHVTAPDLDSRWQLDLIDYTSKDAS